MQIVADTYLHCVCLMYHLGEMVATQAATAEPGDSCIRFTSMLKFDNLYSDYKIDVEVYSLQTQPKFLPHEKKYHINHHNIKVRSLYIFLQIVVKFVIMVNAEFNAESICRR